MTHQLGPVRLGEERYLDHRDHGPDPLGVHGVPFHQVDGTAQRVKPVLVAEHGGDQ
ncbi:hypothetical protein KJK32_44410 [Streptomyces sp. JCM17656]|nr:hypothetical protein KJK32_44410 [Streptomyces sp. JCM17656]